MPIRVIIVRHGERIDEVDRKEWQRIRTEETKHDPPLTATGWDQAKSAGGKLAALLQRSDGESDVTVYSSPTARTLSTAAAIVANFRGKAQSVTPVYALNCCAAAQHYGVAKAFPKGEPSEDVMRGIPLTCWPPLGDDSQVDKNQERGYNFSQVVKDIAANHSDGDLIVIVTHREGIWDVLQSVGARMKGGYCNITLLSFDPSCRSLEIWDPAQTAQPAAQRYATPPGRRRSGRSPPGRSPPAKEAVIARDEVGILPEKETLEAVLSSGTGKVIVHRGGRGGATSTQLWKTPGVRGIWIEGGAVPDGEVVALLSSPMPSEGDEGDFVLVRRSTGIEGWTKVKNVHLRAGM